MIEDQP